MIVRDTCDMTAGELIKELMKVPPDTPVYIENIEDKLFYMKDYTNAILACDHMQHGCPDLKNRGEWACKDCPEAHVYSLATRVVHADNAIYIDGTI